MDWRSIKKSLKKIRRLPLHPQWLVYRNTEAGLRQLATTLKRQRVLDIGCGEQNIRTYLSEDTDYFGLDYYETATHWYHTQPQIFGDAQSLPLGDSSMDTILLLDVLEHLPRPDACLEEIGRVLRPGGRCVLQVPFLYPIHDAPLDFQRWTQYGIQKAALLHNFTVLEYTQTGKPTETAALLSNIALSKTLLNWAEQKNPALLLGPLLALLIPLINVLGWLLGCLSPDDDIMPHSYQFVLEKQS